MRILDILNPAEIKEFENPPVFTYQHRKIFFAVPHSFKFILQEFISPINDIGLILQLGYFRASGRFFRIGNFNDNDIDYLIKVFKYKADQIHFNNYSSSAISRHREMILTELAIRKFNGQSKEFILKEAFHLATKQFNPGSIFRSLCDFIRSHSIEVPSYNALAVIITNTVRGFERDLIDTINNSLNSEQILVLDGFFDKLPQEKIGRNTYKISSFKTLKELMKLNAIRENMSKLKELKVIYALLYDLFNQLNLSDELVEYYANYVLSAHAFQVKQRNQKYLLVICFVKYQFLYLNDIMVQTFLSATQQVLRQADNLKNELLLASQNKSLISHEDILAGILAEAPLIKRLQDTAFSMDKTQEEKFRIIIENIKNPQHNEFLKLVPLAEKLFNETVKKLESKMMYQALIVKSRVLQNKIADLLKHVDFTCNSGTEDKVLKALINYQSKQGNLNKNAPTDFLNKQDQEKIKEGPNGFNESLYKILLAKYLQKSVKSGRINVPDSHQFKAFEDYMIDDSDWNRNKEQLMARAGLTYLSDWPRILKILEEKLIFQIKETFGAINRGENKFVKKRKNNKLQFITPSKEKKAPEIELYPDDLYVTIYEVLHVANELTGFTKKLTHKMEEYQRDIMPNIANFASIIGWGCNLGIGLMAKKSKNLNIPSLEKTSNWHITSKNLLEANDRIIEIIDSMPISTLFKDDESLLRSASDGQKFTMALDSIHSNYSSKYFGKEKGIIVYSFMAEHYPITYTTTFSAGEFEAWYILDGLLHYQPIEVPRPKSMDKVEKKMNVEENNEDIEDNLETNRLHSTDQHGVSFINSAICYLLKIEYQPRFKNIHNVKLYGTDNIPIIQQVDFQINAGKNINTAIILEQWDNILRLVTSLKLKHVSPSVILKRLTSYSNKHPLNLALRELGKLVQTNFVLKYMHLEDLRQIINHQQTQVESMHQLSDEMNLGHNGLIMFATKEELLIMARSKQILINSIVIYNYAYQTIKMNNAGIEEKKLRKQALTHSAAFAFAHVNFQGVYDFSEDVLKDALKINLIDIMGLEL